MVQGKTLTSCSCGRPRPLAESGPRKVGAARLVRLSTVPPSCITADMLATAATGVDKSEVTVRSAVRSNYEGTGW